MAQCYNSVEACGRILFPEHFTLPETPLHKKINDAIDAPENRKVVVAAPRGLGKTTTMSIAKCAQSILFGKHRFIVYVSNSLDAAQRQTDNLRRELLTNQTIKTIFGSIRPEKYDGIDESFSKTAWVAQSPAAGTQTLVLPRGNQQQIRGLKFGALRPDLLIFDDLEESALLTSEEQRKKLKDWFFSDALECVAQHSAAENQIIYIDTLKHEDALLANLLELPDWYSIRLSICDENYNSNAPTFKTTEEIKRKVEQARVSGTLDHFYREHMSEPIAHEDATFKQEYFKYYDETKEGLHGNPEVENFVIVDPAKTARKTSAYSAIVGVGVNLRTNAIYVRDLIMERLESDEVIQRALDMCERLEARVIGVETTGLEAWVEQPFRDAIGARGMSLEFIGLHAKKGKGELGYESGKVGRVSGLAPYYRQGLIYHNPLVCAPLEIQLRGFPRSKRWDAMDALAYTLEILDYGERNFWPQRCEVPGYDIEAEYAELERDYAMPPLEVDDFIDYDLDLNMDIQELNAGYY